jgi:hypothetical protein
MEISDYIKMKLTDLVKKFSEARARYEYDQYANQHVIEILPQSVFQSDQFLDWMVKFCEESITRFPTEDIGFISEDAVVPLEKVDFSVQGAKYGLTETKPHHKASTRYYSEAHPRSQMVCEGEIPYSKGK